MPEVRPVHIATRNGKVRVVASVGGEFAVRDGWIEEDPEGGVYVRRESSSDRIEVDVPDGTDVTIGTTSGSVECSGPLGSVRIATVSGKIHVEQAVRVDVRTRSGAVDIGTCGEVCRVVTTSSKVHVGRAHLACVAAVSGLVALERVADAEVKTVSGKVLMATSGGGRVAVKTVSGKVEILVPRERPPSMRLKSVSGRVEKECDAGDDGEIAVATVSGQVRVSSG
jgi:DUF4097 and DUF4098 domain-containing protein YvlB